MKNGPLINLGGACYTAELLNHFGLRNISLPFDWLYNLDGGLRYVADILVDDFGRFLDRDAYILSDHPQWPDKHTVVNKHYPLMAFLHSSPREPSEYETLTRRAQRLREILKASDEITFLYYRFWTEPEYRDLGDDRHAAQLDTLKDEARYFAERFAACHRATFRLIAIYMAPGAEHLAAPDSLVSEAYCVNFETMEPFAYEGAARTRATRDFQSILKRHAIRYSGVRIFKNRLRQTKERAKTNIRKLITSGNLD